MQRVIIICLSLLAILATNKPLFAQESFTPGQLYFQGEVIRKVSVGHNAVWVVKGQDSTGVGKLDLQGVEHDYTSRINTRVPLTGIVGKYGDSAMIATKGNYLLMYDKGKVLRLDETYGVSGKIINDISGNQDYTYIATEVGFHESSKDSHFYHIPFLKSALRLSPMHEGISIIASHDNETVCSKDSFKNALTVLIKDGGGYTSTAFNNDGITDLNSIAVFNGYPVTNITLYAGHAKGLQIRTKECGSESSNLLQGTAVYVVRNYRRSMLIGTENGLFYCSQGNINPKMIPIVLGAGYKILDIAVDEQKKEVWLATDQGLLKLNDNIQQQPVVLTDDNIEWVKNIGSKDEDKPGAMVSDARGNMYVTGSFRGQVNFGDSTLTSKNLQDYYVVKYSPAGELIWVRSASYPQRNSEIFVGQGFAIAVDKNENVVVLLNHNFGNITTPTNGPDFGNGVVPPFVDSQHSYIVKYNSEGIPQWAHPHPQPLWTNIQLELDQTGNIYLAQKYEIPSQWRVEKFTSEFESQWSKSFSPSFNNFKLKPNGDFYLSGSFSYNLKVDKLEFIGSHWNNLIIVYFDKTGTPQWGSHFGEGPANDHIRRIVGIGFDQMGNTFIAGDFADRLSIHQIVHNIKNPNAHGFFYGKLNPLGKFEWVKIGEAEEFWPITQLVVDSVGSSFLTGKFRNTLTIDDKAITGGSESEVFLMKFDPGGDLAWNIAFPGISHHYYAHHVIAKGDNNSLFLSGELLRDTQIKGTFLSANGPSNIFMAKISDPYSESNSNIVRGKTYFDKNKNGKFDHDDQPIPNHIIKVEPGPVYSKSDNEGNYLFYLKAGDYTIDQIIPNDKGKITTPTVPQQPYSVKLTATKIDTAGFDFANDVKVSPFLSVDVTSTRFRRCFTNTTKVEYCNEGFADAQNVQLVLEYPDYVIPIASSIPWTSKRGNTYTFTIGAMAAQSCRTLTLKDSVICGNEFIRGLTQCIKASILPANTAINMHPDWDGSDIELSAECKDNGFVRVGFRNSGTGPMADSASFSIFLDQQQVYSGKYKLKAGESQSLNLLANGKPLHLEAILTPHHPQKRAVSITIQGCSNSGQGIINKGYLNQFPQNDEAETVELVCLPIIDSYDPNDKQVAPAGITSTNNIAEDTMLEYTIRFQNTGTDTAYTVVIVDPLSEHLDISTLKVGIASHPVKWEFSRQSQPSIIWRFKKINLPDSTTNEKASHGFVKFKIRPKAALPKGTIISNKADIYFDYNSPIITNEVFNTIGLPEPAAGEKVVLQNCNARVALEQEQNIEAVVCGDSSYKLLRTSPATGRGMWKVVKGTAVLADPFSHETVATNLSFGENEFSWEVTYCDQQVSSNVTVRREQPLQQPKPSYPAYICEGEPYPALTTTGEGVEWYRDEALTQLVLKGNSYQPSGQESEMLYVIRRSPSCTSATTVVPVVVHAPPQPPVASAAEACVDVSPPVLTAQGSNLRWYGDAAKQQLLGQGESFSPADKNSRNYYVTQSSEYCESQPLEVSFTAKHFDVSKARIANVVTPNGDEKNQLYYLKDFESKECLGAFISIRIYNRWGKTVYESNETNFSWNASLQPSGVYFYKMVYQLQSFQGHVQVLR